MGFPRKWSGYLSGAVKSTKILSHLSSKNALTSNSVSRNNPTSSAVTLNDLHNTWFHLATQKSAFCYCGRPKSMWYSGGFRGGAWRAQFPAYFSTKLRPEWPKTIFLRPPPSYLRVWMTAPPLPPSPLIWRSGSATVAFNFFCPGGRGEISLILTFRLPTSSSKSQKYTHVQHPFDKI